MALLRSETRIYGNATVDTFLKIDGNNTSFPATSNNTGALRVAGGIGVKGNVFSSGNITALNADLGNLVVANYFTGTLTTANQYNITNVGTLGNVTVTNSANVGTLNATDGIFTGNLTVSGNFVYANVLTLNIKDPIIEQGGDTDGSPLISNDNKDRGQLLHYYTTKPVDAFMGWDNSNAEFAFGSNVSVTGDVVTFNSYGNIRANYFLGNTLGSSETATTVTANAQPNITSVGTLNYLNVSNLNGGNGTVTANYFTGIVTTSHQPNINSLGVLSNLTVTGPVNLGNVANLTIYGGNDGQYLKTDGNGVVTWSTVVAGNANISGSNTQLFFNDANSNTLGSSANLTFNKGTNTLTVDKIVANGALLTNINGSNVIGEVAYAAVANSVAGSNVSGNVSWAITSNWANTANAVSGSNVSGNVNDAVHAYYADTANSVTWSNVSDTPTTISGYGITDAYSNTNAGAYLSTYTGNLTAGNANLGNAVTANFFIGNGSQLTGIVASGVANNASLENITATKIETANMVVTSTANISNLVVTSTANLGNVASLTVSGGSNGQFLKTDGNGNLSFSSVQACVVSQITNIIAGSAIDVSVDYANSSYPAGVFTLQQLGPVSFTTTDAWSTGGLSKNAYANYIAGTVNTANVSITLTLANATFNIQSSDTITIGGSSLTGANLTGLGITGTGGTYTIPNTYLNANVQTNATNSVTTSLTTSRGVKTSSGSTLTNNQPVPFNVTAFAGTFSSATVPYWSLNQTFNWNATLTSGATVASGNLTYANGSTSGSLTSSGATSGTSTSLDSTSSYTIYSNDYIGAGAFGAGTRTMTANISGTVNAATKYYPLFYKITANSTVPTFTTSDSHGVANIVIGTTYANTSTTETDYLWMATPTTASHTFKHVFLGSDIIDTPAASGNTTISGQAYRVWGFTTFSQVASIIITS